MKQPHAPVDVINLAMSLVLAVAIGASLFAFVFNQVSSEAANEQGQHLTPTNDPIGLLSVPWLALVAAILVFSAAAYLSFRTTAQRRTQIARGCAMAKAVGIGGLGLAAAGFGLVGGLLSGGYDDANLLGFAIAAYGIVLLAPAGVYVAIRATCRTSLGWRAFGALVDAGVSWLFVSALIYEGLQYSQSFWAGTVSHPIYNPSPYGDWPLIWACGFGIGWLALSVPVVVNALPSSLGPRVLARLGMKPAILGVGHP